MEKKKAFRYLILEIWLIAIALFIIFATLPSSEENDFANITGLGFLKNTFNNLFHKATTYTITINVKSNGNALQGVLIFAVNSADSTKTYSQVTDSAGKAVLKLPKATYNIILSKNGFETYSTNYTASKSETLNLAMQASCVPNRPANTCGTDDCGQTFDNCNSGFTCQNSQCVAACTPSWTDCTAWTPETCPQTQTRTRTCNDIVCGSAPITQSQNCVYNPPTQEDFNAQFCRTLNEFDFSSGIPANWTLENAGKSYSLNVVSDFNNTTNKILKFTVAQGDKYQNTSGNRSELALNATYPLDMWYSIDFYIPQETFQTMTEAQSIDNWQIIDQWHDKPDPSKGETWATIGRSPPVALYYGVANDRLFVYLRSGTYDNRPIVAKTYDVQFNSWNRFKAHIKWSTGSDGFVEAWLNNKPFTQGKVIGANLNNDVGNYLKFGIYRNQAITTTNTVYFDNLKLCIPA